MCWSCHPTWARQTNSRLPVAREGRMTRASESDCQDGRLQPPETATLSVSPGASLVGTAFSGERFKTSSGVPEYTRFVTESLCRPLKPGGWSPCRLDSEAHRRTTASPKPCHNVLLWHRICNHACRVRDRAPTDHTRLRLTSPPQGRPECRKGRQHVNKKYSRAREQFPMAIGLVAVMAVLPSVQSAEPGTTDEVPRAANPGLPHE